MSAENTNAGGGEAIKLLSDALHEAVAMLEVDPEADAPGSDLYTWLRTTPRFALDAALSAQSTGSAGVAAEPVAGWKLVPVEPTQAMWAAYRNADEGAILFHAAYRAMIAAAPTPPAGGGETNKPDPVRLLKDALFACLKAGFEEKEYGGVLVDGGRFAHIKFWKAEPSPASPAGDLISLSAGATQGTAFTVGDEVRVLIEPQPWPGAYHLIAKVSGERYEENAAAIVRLWNAYRSGRLIEAAPAAPRKGPSADELDDAIQKVLQKRLMATLTFEERNDIHQDLVALLTPADRGETQAGLGVRNGSVSWPQNAEEAKAMWLVGERWMRDNAPEQLRAPSPDQNRGEPDQGGGAR